MDQPKKTKASQNQQILKFLKTHKRGITTWDAFERFGVTRLSARIADLRKSGSIIITKKETGTNRNGNKSNYARYILIEE